MTDRRTLLAKPAQLAGADHSAHMGAEHNQFSSENRGAVPDVLVNTHQGKTVKLYSELIRDNVVMINFMTIDREAKFPISAKMADIAKELGSQLGRDVQLISITSDPQADTVERLAAFHRQMGGLDGWTFVRTPEQDTDLLAKRFYRHGRNVALGGRTDVVQYGNAKVGLWAAFPWDIHSRDAAERVNWVMPRQVAQGEMRRAGPRALDEAGPRWNNRRA